MAVLVTGAVPAASTFAESLQSHGSAVGCFATDCSLGRPGALCGTASQYSDSGQFRIQDTISSNAEIHCNTAVSCGACISFMSSSHSAIGYSSSHSSPFGTGIFRPNCCCIATVTSTSRAWSLKQRLPHSFSGHCIASCTFTFTAA